MRNASILMLLCAVLLAACHAPKASDPMKNELDQLSERTRTTMLAVQQRLAGIAATQAARDADRNTVLGLLREARPMLVGVDFFVDNQGTAWRNDSTSVSLTKYPFWDTLRQGDDVMGVSLEDPFTGQPSVIVCKPVAGEKGLASCVGRIVWLGGLRQRLVDEVPVQDGHVFFILDQNTRTLLDSSDPDLIFDEPLKQDSATLRAAIQQIMAEKEGTVSYSWADVEKVCTYRLSPLLGWHYAISAPVE